MKSNIEELICKQYTADTRETLHQLLTTVIFNALSVRRKVYLTNKDFTVPVFTLTSRFPEMIFTGGNFDSMRISDFSTFDVVSEYLYVRVNLGDGNIISIEKEK